jgi:hypothetical protein
MSMRLKHAAIILGMAAALAFAKYQLARLMVRPFSFDPCDAVNVFSFITIMMVAVVSLFRVFRPYSQGPTPAAQHIYVIRSQQAFALAVFTTLAADVIALARHLSPWDGSVWRTQLLAWLGVYAAVALAAQLLVFAAQRTLPQGASTRWKRGASVLAAAILLLVFCPEWPIDNSSQTAHILTVVLGALVVFVPMRFLLPVVVPCESNRGLSGRALFSSASEWGALVAGVLLFSFGFWADMHKWNGTLRYVRPSLAIAPMLIAYAFLGESLGLIPRESQTKLQMGR